MADILAAAQAAAAQAPTLDDIKSWPATVPVPQACKAFQISKSYGYELAARNEFPARVIKLGRSTRIVTASIVAALEADLHSGGDAA